MSNDISVEKRNSGTSLIHLMLPETTGITGPQHVASIKKMGINVSEVIEQMAYEMVPSNGVHPRITILDVAGAFEKTNEECLYKHIREYAIDQVTNGAI